MKVKHIKDTVNDTLQYIDNRRHGTDLPLVTSKKKLNRAIDGFSWGRIYTLAGLSGSGKSITVEELKRDLVRSNPQANFNILSFEFEMLAMDQIARNLSGITEKSLAELYSAEDNTLSDQDFNKLVEASQKLSDYPIYYVDDVGTVSDIVSTIATFVETHHKDNPSKGLIVTIDHILLTKGVHSQDEKTVVDELMHTCVYLKKYYAQQGQKVMFILLSQLNRNIETQDRVMNPMFHYPTKNDIFAASSVYYCSDVVLIFHKPTVVEGIRGGYGPPRKDFPAGLPLFDKSNRPIIYWHIIKSRFGTNQILMMVDDFKHSRVLEFQDE